MSAAIFGQLTNVLSGATLITALLMLWRRSINSYTTMFVWQSISLGLLTAIAGIFTGRAELFLVAGAIVLVKVAGIPWLLRRALRILGHKHDQEHKEYRYLVDGGEGTREVDPFVNIPASVLVGGGLVVLAYLIIGPVAALSTTPTRFAMPLGLAVIFIGLFILISRKRALSQIIGFLVLENGIALLAVLATFGLPLIVEMGATLDLLLGFLVMQVFLYRIANAFVSSDPHEMTELRY